MNLLEEIKTLRKEGRTDNEIANLLRSRKLSEQKIEDAFSQLQIRSAIVGNEAPQPEESIPSPPSTQEVDGGQEEPPYQEEPQDEQMQESPQVYPDSPQSYAQAPSEQYAQPQYQQYQQYSQPQSSPQLSSDTISEIAEQVVAEKLSGIKNQLEKTIDMKNTFEARTESLNERLKRLEQIIDRLQLSILQRVGAYMSEVDNVKKELTETQKSFKSQVQKSPQHQQPKQFNKSAQ